MNFLPALAAPACAFPNIEVKDRKFDLQAGIDAKLVICQKCTADMQYDRMAIGAAR
jgi:hypothetical protein